MKVKFVKQAGYFLKRNAPAILCVTACGGVAISNYLTGKAVLKADKLLNEPHDANTKKEVVKAYIPPVATAAATICCIIGAHLMNKKIQAGLIAAYGLLDSSYRCYRAKVRSASDDGEDRDDAIRQEMVQDRLDKTIVKVLPLQQEAYEDDKKELWIDDYSEVPYSATKNDILMGVFEINRQLSDAENGRGYASLRDIYQYTNRSESNENADVYGWSWDYMDHEWSCTWIDVYWNDKHKVKDENGNEIQCNYIEFFCPPIPDFLDYDPDASLA